jgi:hypothetical protein
MKFLQDIKAKLTDGAATAPLSRSLGISSNADAAAAAEGGVNGDAENNTTDTTTTSTSTTTTGNKFRPLLKLGPFTYPSSSSYPSLYSEANDMISLSNLIYVLVDIRDWARSTTTTSSNNTTTNTTTTILSESSAKQILNIPLPLVDVVQIVLTEAESLKVRLNIETQTATLAALASLTKGTTTMAVEVSDEKVETATNDNSTGGLFNLFTSWCVVSSSLGGVVSDTITTAGSGEPYHTSTITAMGDSKSESELVYAIGVNPQKCRITVIFRGSVTTTDFVVDSRIGLVQAKHPRQFNVVNENNGSSSSDTTTNNDDDDVGIHQGFYEYLMSSGKYIEIMKHLQQLLLDVPIRKTYKIYITGHSLGGALATLFGFYASCSSDTTSSPVLPLPITIVSVASPRVGNIAFAQAFVELESLGKVRHLRIANHKDPVTLNPTVSAKRALALSAKMFSPLGYLALMVTGNGEGGEEEVYYHTGMKMKLRKDICPLSEKQYEVTYSGAPFVAAVKATDSTRNLVVVENSDEKQELAEIVKEEQAKKKKSSSSDMINVAYHFGDTYTERILAVKRDLKGMTLNDLYYSKARDLL